VLHHAKQPGFYVMRIGKQVNISRFLLFAL